MKMGPWRSARSQPLEPICIKPLSLLTTDQRLLRTLSASSRRRTAQVDLDTRRLSRVSSASLGRAEYGTIAVCPILADLVDVKRGDQQCETVSQPSIQPDKVD